MRRGRLGVAIQEVTPDIAAALGLKSSQGAIVSRVATKIVETLEGFVNDPKFNLGNHGYTLRRAKGKGASGFVAYKNEKTKEAFAPSSKIELDPPRQEGTAGMPGPEAP